MFCFMIVNFKISFLAHFGFVDNWVSNVSGDMRVGTASLETESLQRRETAAFLCLPSPFLRAQMSMLFVLAWLDLVVQHSGHVQRHY